MKRPGQAQESVSTCEEWKTLTSDYLYFVQSTERLYPHKAGLYKEIFNFEIV